mmetsp:Transcript_10807/g.21519  ORF Transcript_10807/g.21519 Transcript_10807/m.21519 type:complete len:422 (-) Transcript_10807:292-1557(-)
MVIGSALDGLLHGLVHVQHIGLVLLEVVGHDVHANELGVPFLRDFLPDHKPKHGALTAPVRAEEGDPVSLLDDHVRSLEERVAFVPVRYTFNLGNFVAEPGSRGEPESEGLASEGRLLYVVVTSLELFEAGDPLLDGLGLLGLKLLDPSLLLLDLLLLRIPLGLPSLHLGRFLLQEPRVVAVVARRQPTLSVHDLRANLVKEFSVVAYDDHGNILIAEEVLEPLDALHVEVVGGLVEKEDVGVLQQHLAKAYSHLPTARKAADGELCVDAVKAHEVHDLLSPGFEARDVLGVRLRLKSLHSVQNLLHCVSVGRVALLKLLFRRPQPREDLVLHPKHAHELLLEHPRRHQLVHKFLPQHGHSQVRAALHNVPACGLEGSLEDLELRGLAAPVHADQPHSVPSLDVPGHARQHLLVAESDVDV